MIEVAKLLDDPEGVVLQERPHLVLVKIADGQRLDDILFIAFDAVDEIDIEHLAVEIDPLPHLVSANGLAGTLVENFPVKGFRLYPCLTENHLRLEHVHDELTFIRKVRLDAPQASLLVDFFCKGLEGPKGNGDEIEFPPECEGGHACVNDM